MHCHRNSNQKHWASILLAREYLFPHNHPVTVVGQLNLQKNVYDQKRNHAQNEEPSREFFHRRLTPLNFSGSEQALDYEGSYQELPHKLPSFSRPQLAFEALATQFAQADIHRMTGLLSSDWRNWTPMARPSLGFR